AAGGQGRGRGAGRPVLTSVPNAGKPTAAPSQPLLDSPSMPVFRKDTFGRAWVLLSPERGLLASDFGSVAEPAERRPLSPGSAAVRDVATYGDEAGGPWTMRVVEHPHDSLTPRPFVEEGDALFRHGPSVGHQEIIVEHPDARQTLDRMPRGHLVDVLRLYRDRIALHGEKPGVRHVQLTRNVGRAAGALSRSEERRV